MAPSIGDSYAACIGGPYADRAQNQAVAKETSFERIKQALLDAGKNGTQEEIAKLAGIKQPSVSEWKNEGTTPSLENAIAIGAKLNVCVEWIITGRGPKRPGPPMEPAAQALWDAWPRIPSEDRQQVVGFAQAKAGPTPRRATPAA